MGYDDTTYKTVHIRKSSICKNSYSVAKLFVVSAIGILCDQKLLSVDDKVLDILKDEIPASTLSRIDERWHSVTVDTALLHGLALPGGFLDIDCSDPREFGEDYLSYLLTYPLCGNHGRQFVYTDGAYYLLARCVEAIAQKRLDEFLWEHLFTPLSFREVAWSTCPQGHCMGATGLYLSTEDMVKLGHVYLNGGQFANKPILSQEWVHTVFRRGYELRKIKDDLYGKGGMLGQMLAVVKDKGLSIAWHGYDDFDGIALLDFINERID
jgi:CubicO group peptidase (beta-lactamase class C family)